ncbi:MAG TPA: helix-hairpin-helix domain-containing protein [Acidobacteriaceae bacterium]|nr:helix-hairpin-helix domain-containing protein [Acidobacteriaceae bacterium]
MEPEKIDLNTATGKHLTELPGIGADVARRIVAYRKRHGGMFHDWEELLNVNGFPGDRLEEIKARAVLRLPSAEKTVEAASLHHFPGRKKG